MQSKEMPYILFVAEYIYLKICDIKKRIRQYLPLQYRSNVTSAGIDDIKTATLWKKKKSTFEPDYCAVRLKNDPWIVQPFEHYEEIRIEEIKNRHQKK